MAGTEIWEGGEGRKEVNMVLNVNTFHKAYQGRGEGGGG